MYRYRLVGLDVDWKTTHSGRIEYQNIGIGSYTFEVVAIDRDLVYSESPARVELNVVRDTRDEQIDELEERVRERTRDLIQSEKMAALGSLVAGIAHEINNPIGAINGAADVLNRGIDRIAEILDSQENGKESTQIQGFLSLLRDNNRNAMVAGDRIARVMDNLKNFARLDQAEFQQADIHEGLDSTLNLLQHQLDNPISLVKDYGDIPRIYCYPGELNQVFMNLLTNAIQTVEERGVITIQTSMDEDFLDIRISDTGKGIPAENIDRIFDPGFTTQGVGVGTGLGLSISYNIIQKHRGKIEVESEVGKGSTFTVRLPTDLKEANDSQGII